MKGKKRSWNVGISFFSPDLADSQQCYIEYNTIPCLPDPSAHSLGSLIGLILIIHGEFSEIETLRPESQLTSEAFNRTIVLGPSIDISVCDTLKLRALGRFKPPGSQRSSAQHLLTSTSSAPSTDHNHNRRYIIHMPPGTGAPAGREGRGGVARKELLIIEVEQEG